MTEARRATPGRTGGKLLADALVAQGVTHAFCVPGESYLDLLDGLYSVRNRLQLVTCRFEAGAVHMAEAHGKLTGKPGVAIVTRGPGACHAAIGVHVAFQDSTPLVLLVGQIPVEETDRESFQEVDYRRMFGPIAKWVTQIDDEKRIPELMAHAFDVATSGRPGPVVVAISEEMQKRLSTVPDIGPAEVLPPHPAPDALPRLMDMLARAKRPLAILGGSRWTAQGKADIRDWLLANDLPVSVAFRRMGLFDGTSPNYVGDLGVGADAGLVAKAKESDLVLAIGTRIGEPVSQGYTLFDMAGATPIVHVYPDQAEIGRVYRPALGIVSEVNAFAAAAKAAGAVKKPAWSAWTKELRALRVAQAVPPDYEGPLNLATALQALEKELPEDTIFTTDAGNFATWPNRFMHFGEKQDFLGPTNGAMGYAVPAAIGAKITHPERAVIGFVGDGGFLMTGQEIATAFHHSVNPVILVFNNQMYGTIRMYQERTYPHRVSGTALTNPDFAKFIEAFGGHGEIVERTEELVPAVKRALASGKPAVVEVRTNPEQVTNRATIAELRAQAAKAAASATRPETAKAARTPAPRRTGPRPR
ncbi:thiamine pyrophosphate-binding protein [Roseomonas alkaliterrae]|uniref:Acetolactate synthase-1/2/3 large subunit n=1 Tax=Neoroseomonas alkaliterrae TaxID=1452450 RepID=A0A840Y0R2_9PROT|nr:thiamine pyrophosphate-dependent enzyme [Neoroseomonas alkaliterrae]MBB5689997.1 acetolactate synthase-1/2/3 large subunit [Neoroseomonas alkaliterrae]MBR0675525.1 thiamine pyrophosphate-binding protein [Neoroseomonas alkaliterrae]